MDVSSFEFSEITFSLHLQNIRMAILYHPGTDGAFTEEVSQFLEILSVCREKLVICGDFNYWLDNPSLKPYTNEFMSILDVTSPLHESRLHWIHDPHPYQPPRVTPRQAVPKKNNDSAQE